MTITLHSTTAVSFSGDHRNPNLHHHRLRRPNLSFRPSAVAQDRISSSLSSSQTLYELLEISSSDPMEEVKKAYKKLARKFHPDVAPPDRTMDHTKRFIEVQEAYETLSDPQRRGEYDRMLANGLTRFGFSNRHFNQEMETRSEWRNRWQDQISDLKKRSHAKNNNIINNNISDENLSWGARMRMKRAAKASNE